MTVYFIADTHFGHEGIIKLCNRPFNNLQEMHETLVKNWNARVEEKDDVYIVGDFWFRGEADDAIATLKTLHGKKHLLIGNHDRQHLKNHDYLELFEDAADILTLRYDNNRIVLCHYPIVEWDGYFRGSYHIHGHIHNSRSAAFDYLKNQENALNAGVDITRFMPVTLDELKHKNALFKASDLLWGAG